MDRKNFIASACVLCGAGVALSLLQGCGKEGAGLSSINFDADLHNSGFSALSSVGGYVVTDNNQVYIIRTANNGNASDFSALYLGCTHEGVIVSYDGGTHQFTCPRHGAKYDANGAVQNGPANRPLSHCSITQNGSILTIKG